MLDPVVAVNGPLGQQVAPLPVDGGTQVWTAPSTGRSVTSLVGNTATWTTKVDRFDELYTNATDCLGNAADYSYDQHRDWSPRPGHPEQG
ncbi:MAG TPA: hypothetical protein VFQ11_01315 [Nocardioidaceae bacterium]|jgi:hypothetical protein|nr:hypothetical protein [Nocardioidaceae bacterium]